MTDDKKWKLMADTEIDYQLALAMGFPAGVMRGSGWISVQNKPYVGHDLFAPTAVGDHLWKVIEWMEGQGKGMTIRATYALTQGDVGVHDEIVHFRIVRFGGGIENSGSSFKDLTPRHICLAALKAVEA